MSHFYAEIHGNKGVATRCGTKSSGMYGHIRGWNVGCEVMINSRDEDEGGDRISVYLTSGSGRKQQRKLIGYFTAEDL